MKPSILQSAAGLVLVGASLLANAQDASSSTSIMVNPATNTEGPLFTIQTKTDLTTTTDLPSDTPSVSVSGVTSVPTPHITANGTNSSTTQTSQSAGTPEPTPSSIKAAGEQVSLESSMMGMVIFCALGLMIL